MESTKDELDIDCLPDEMLINIFSRLSHNELGKIARVCRRWNVLTKIPILWKEVNVVFDSSHRSGNTVVKCFVNILPPSVTHITVRFMRRYRVVWTEQLNFEELCGRLKERCPRLKMLILNNAALSDSLPLVIGLCTQFLPDLKILIFCSITFADCPTRVEFGGMSKIEVLGVFGCRLRDLTMFSEWHFMPPFTKMPYLKKLYLQGRRISDSWIRGDISFLKQLHVLNLGGTFVTYATFHAVWSHGLNLRQLYMCNTRLTDRNLNFNNSVFPHLETICLRDCPFVTCEGIVSLIQSCQSLQNVYVKQDMALLYAEHPFTVANNCKLEIVKVISDCRNHQSEDCVIQYNLDTSNFWGRTKKIYRGFELQRC